MVFLLVNTGFQGLLYHIVYPAAVTLGGHELFDPPGVRYVTVVPWCSCRQMSKATHDSSYCDVLVMRQFIPLNSGHLSTCTDD